MFTFIIFTSCLLYTLSSGQINMNVTHPTVGPIYPVANNNSLLNFTFIYPANYQFDKLYVRFTIFDFIGDNSLNPQPYPFSWNNFTNSNFSLPWVVPPTIFQSGDYVIACFEWVETNMTDQLVSDTNQCVLTRAPVNYTILSISNPMISTAIVTNTTANITAYFPTQLPYDQVNISSNLNGTISPSMTDATMPSSTTNVTGNNTYSTIIIFYFTNLTSNTYYNLCVYFNYANSLIDGSQTMNTQCQNITTSTATSSSSSTSPSSIISSSSSTSAATSSSSSTSAATSSSSSTSAATSSSSSTSPTSTTSSSSSSLFNKVISNLTVIILLFIFAFM